VRAIAYQDGLTSDVYIATKAGTWTTTPFAAGPSIDGVSVAATSGPGGTTFIAWDKLDTSASPVNNLVVKTR